MIYLKDKTLTDLQKQKELTLYEFLEANPKGNTLLALYLKVGVLEYVKVPQTEEDVYELRELALTEGKNHGMKYFLLHEK